MGKMTTALALIFLFCGFPSSTTTVQGCDMTHTWSPIQTRDSSSNTPDLAFLELALRIREALASENLSRQEIFVEWPDSSGADSPPPLLDKAPDVATIPREIFTRLASDGVDAARFWRKSCTPGGEIGMLCKVLQEFIGRVWRPALSLPQSRWCLRVSCQQRYSRLAWSEDMRTRGFFGLSRFDQALMRVCLTDPKGTIRLIEEFPLKGFTEVHFASEASGSMRMLGILVQAGFPPFFRKEETIQTSPDPSLRGDKKK